MYIKALIVIIFNTSLVLAQNQQKSLEKLSEINENIAKTWNNQLFIVQNPDKEIELSIDSIFFVQKYNVNPLEVQQKINQQLISLNNKDKGLSFTNGFIRNTSSAFDEELLIFANRLQTGIDWDILKNGWYDNQIKNKILSIENQILELSENKANLGLHKKLILLKIQEIFAQQYHYYYTKKLDLLSNYFLIYRDLFYLGLIPKHEYLSLKQELETVKLNVQNTNVSPLNQPYKIPIPTIIKEENLSYNSNLKLDSLEKLYLNQSNLKSNYLNSIQLKAFTRANFVNIASDNSRNFLSFGINLNLPITGKRDYSDLFKSQTLLKLLPKQTELEQDSVDLVNYFVQNNKTHYQILQIQQKYAVLLEEMRKIRAKSSVSAENTISFNTFSSLNNWYDLKINEIKLLQEMYLQTLMVYDIVEQNEFLKITQKSAPNYTQLPKSFLYIWSKSFKLYSSKYIAEYINYNEFDEILVSVGNDQNNIDNLKKLMEILPNKNFHLVFADNYLADKNYLEKINVVYSNFNSHNIKGIHLDVEPHVTDEWKIKSNELLQKLDYMTKDVSVWCRKNNLKISVSIPKHFPENTVESLYENCDYIMIMAYENVKVDFISKKITEELKNDTNYKTVIALRAQDFSNRLEMENTFDELLKQNNIKNKAYHDLNHLWDLDNVLKGK